MWLYTECYMWRKVDEIPTSAWTGFHLIWVLVAFRNMSALMYSVGMFVSMCLSIHIIWIVTNWRQQTQKAVDEADAHVSLTTLSGGVATWDICIDVIFFLTAVREDKLMATHKICHLWCSVPTWEAHSGQQDPLLWGPWVFQHTFLTLVRVVSDRSWLRVALCTKIHRE